jgi:membrane-associated protease RseP (regulator of RpoE activity)
MATLSLYLFNLLPLPFLDGTELCKELIDMAFERRDAFGYDIESLEHPLGAQIMEGNGRRGLRIWYRQQ